MQLLLCSSFVRGCDKVEKTKYPIVLIHGMMAKNFPFFPAFRFIADFLRAQELRIYVANQDGVGTIADNAAQLKAEITDILKREGCEKVNLIAHSKGGLDARYMISRLEMEARVASLTTLSTPHHGSRLSATLLKMPAFLAKTIAFFIDAFFRVFRDEKPNVLALAQELTVTSMERFNTAVPNAPSVYYQSYSSSSPHKKAFLRFIPYKLSRYCEQDDTDGMVSVSSSQWGNYRGSMEGEIDHFQMVGVYGSKKKLTSVGLFYLHIVRQLRQMGF